MEDVSSGKYKFMKNCHELGRDVGVRNYNAQTSGVSRPGIRLRSSFFQLHGLTLATTCVPSNHIFVREIMTLIIII